MKYNIEKNINNYIKYDCLIFTDNQIKKISNNILKNNIYKIYKKNQNNLIKKINNFYYFKININKHKKDIIILCKNKIKKLNNIIKIFYKLIIKSNYKYILTNINNIFKKKNQYWNIRNIIQNLEKLNYKFIKFKNKKKKHKNIKINFLIKNKNNIKLSKLAIHHGICFSIGITKAKNINNMPPNICNSTYINKKIYQKFKNKKNIKISSINKKKMIKIGMNAYLAVSQGSYNEPIASIIKFNNNKNSKPIIIIGKGLTFDSGGISLKNNINMHHMKYDMSGAGIIYGIMYALYLLNIKINIIGILACSENMPDSKSYRPGDIIKTLSGKTVEIINTDAEGRLVLCDILTYVEKYNPEIVIDIATLTGACSIALGDKITGFFSNNNKITKYLKKASQKTSDYIWELPLFEKYNKLLDSNIADIKNCSNKSTAATIVAACFLNNFTRKYKWIHLDIAGTAYNEMGSTGKPINLLLQFLIDYSKKINKQNG